MRFSAFLIFLIFFLLSLFRTPALAQNPNHIPQDTQAQNLSQNVPNNLSTYSQRVLIEVVSAFGCQLAGVNPSNPNQPCLGTDPKTGKIGFTQSNGGLIGFAGNMIIALYTPPAHTSDYIRYLSGNFGLAKNANAQTAGVGLTTIAPIANLWIIFRNIVYLFFVVIFVLIGVGIMLRVKIDPRTVMTIQNQIPKIVIGIILVTLSFPIAGFLIDIMWVVILVIIGILRPLITTPPASYNFLTPFGLVGVVEGIPGGILSVAGGTAGFLGSSIFSSGFDSAHVSSLVNPALPPSPCTDALSCLLGGVGAALSAVLGAIVGLLIGIAVGLIAFFVVIIALLWALFKLWFELLKAYISILIGIIFAPFWIVAGLIPGSGEKVGFNAWIREMFGNLMAFPVAIGMFFLAAIFAQQFKINSDVFFLPPLVGSQSDGFGVIIAFGILMMTPNVVKMTKAAFKSSGMGFGLAGGAIGIAAAGALGGSIKSRLYYRDPRTGETLGPAANVGRNVTSRISNSGVGRGVGNLTRPIRNSSIGRLTWSEERKAKEKTATEEKTTLSADEIRRRTGGA